MNFLDRGRLIFRLLMGSVVLNLVMLTYLFYSGGIRRVFIKMNLLDVSTSRQAFMEEEEARFRKLPSPPGQILFAGDSLIAAGPWAELFTEIHSRGISGETTSGLLGRLDEITEDKPRKIFLLIGANDLAQAVPPVRLISNYRTILTRIRAESPSTAIYAISVLPTNRGFKESPNYTSEKVREVNLGLKQLIAEFPGVQFVDVTDLVTDKSGNLRPDFTNDGLHLSVEGYLAIRPRLEGLVLADEHRKVTEETMKP